MKRYILILFIVAMSSVFGLNVINAESLSFVDDEQQTSNESDGDFLEIVIPETKVEEKGKVLFVVCNKDFQDNELSRPSYILKNAGYIPVVASPGKEECTGVAGDVIEPDIAIEEVNADDYLAISITGGPGSIDGLWKNKKLQELIRAFNKAGKPVGAISESPAILAISKIMRNKNATVLENKDTIREFRRNGVKQQKSLVVPDKNIITASAPYAAQYYAEALVKKIDDYCSAHSEK